MTYYKDADIGELIDIAVDEINNILELDKIKSIESTLKPSIFADYYPCNGSIHMNHFKLKQFKNWDKISLKDFILNIILHEYAHAIRFELISLSDDKDTDEILTKKEKLIISNRIVLNKFEVVKDETFSDNFITYILNKNHIKRSIEHDVYRNCYYKNRKIPFKWNKTKFINEIVNIHTKYLETIKKLVFCKFRGIKMKPENRNKNGWLSPNGILFNCKRLEHINKAIEIVSNEYGRFGGNAEAFLENNGWIKLSGGVFITLYVPTDEQSMFIDEYQS